MFKKLVIITFSFLLYFNQVISDDLKIVYVDVDKIINKSNAGKMVTKQLEKLNNDNIKKFRIKETKLADEEKNLIKQKNVLSKEELQKKVKILQKDVGNYKNEIKTARIDVDKKRINATTKILNVLNPILSEYSSKNSISLIIQKKNIVIGKSDLDITSQILELVNAKIKSVKLN
jgi:outer membrane protein